MSTDPTIQATTLPDLSSLQTEPQIQLPPLSSDLATGPRLSPLVQKETKKIWQVANAPLLHPLVEAFTVDQDYIQDSILLPYDIQASLAHAEMLASINILTPDELSQLRTGLNEIKQLFNEGKFTITPSDEDSHTAIENFLIKNYGDVGNKIHTGRSRNDQSLTMIRLFGLDRLRLIINLVKDVSDSLKERVTDWADIRMPGYTHQQRAMPTTVGKWLLAYADAFADQVPIIQSIINLMDQNPLGSAAGFGIQALKLDRELTAKLLGFSKVQENPLYCGISRGMFESQALASLWGVISLTGRFANEMLHFTMEETQFFSLDARFTTGSSIMPQKRNYDVFEIMRGKTRVFSGMMEQIMHIIPHIMSGYARDLQLTKKPFVEGLFLCSQQLEVMALCLRHLSCHDDKLEAAMSESLYVTERVYEQVAQGVPFRTAHSQIKATLYPPSHTKV
eukprot:TRINITY_DN9988_c0_g1_i1.p1 TRINITY_DN9988_c0_g1~~TRINITY_DN9988_c0_g1_i1.p1  ORF type:complete len:450 (+),score=80.95 TRINITY_DN9988_c0_g1_i1:73-1422(+)